MSADPLLKHPAMPWIVHALLTGAVGLVAFGILQGQMMGTREDIRAIREGQERQQAKMERAAEEVAGINGKLDTLIRRDSQRADAR